jgi:hypothetical protein
LRSTPFGASIAAHPSGKSLELAMLDFMMWITVVACLLAALVSGWALVAFAKYLFSRAQR